MKPVRDITEPAQPGRVEIPFRFWTSFVLQEATGLRAATLSQLVGLLEKVLDASVYYHTHYFLLTHHYLSPEPANEFAYWATEVLGEPRLGELLNSVDTMEHGTLQSLRRELIKTMNAYLQDVPAARFKFVSEGEEFFFVNGIHIVMPTAYQASTLAEFARALSSVSVHTLYYHVFEARLRIGRRTNDFAVWLEGALGLTELAEAVATLNPYTRTLETLRASLLSLMQQELVLGERPHGSVS